MKTSQRILTLAWVSLSLFFVSLPPLAGAQEESQRVRDLEDRVRVLEAEVQQLMILERNAHSIPAATAREASSLPASTENSPAESIVPGAAEDLAADAEKGIPQELLPNLGRIGASAFFDSGANQSPFSLGLGSYVGGGLDLPLALLPGGRLNYEVSIGVAQNSKRAPLTSNVAQITNLAILNALNPSAGTQNLQDALTGTGAAPFAVTTTAKWNAQIFQVVPLALKYDLTRFDRSRIRPLCGFRRGSLRYPFQSSHCRNAAHRRQPVTRRDGSSQPVFFYRFAVRGCAGGWADRCCAPACAARSAVRPGVASHWVSRWAEASNGGFNNAISLALDSRYNYSPGGPSYNVTTSRVGWHF